MGGENLTSPPLVQSRTWAPCQRNSWVNPGTKVAFTSLTFSGANESQVNFGSVQLSPRMLCTAGNSSPRDLSRNTQEIRNPLLRIYYQHWPEPCILMITLYICYYYFHALDVIYVLSTVQKHKREAQASPGFYNHRQNLIDREVPKMSKRWKHTLVYLQTDEVILGGNVLLHSQ